MADPPRDPNAEHRAALHVIGGTFHLYRSGEGGASVRTVGVREDPDDPENELFNAAVDGLESLLLALYAEGVDVTSKEAVEAINTALCELGDRYS